MQKFYLLLAGVFALTATINEAFGQYSIPNKTESKQLSLLRQLSGPQIPQVNIPNKASLRYEREQRRKARNILHIKANLGVNQYSFKNRTESNYFNGRATFYLKHVYNDLKKFDITTEWDSAYGLGENNDKIQKTEDRFRLTSLVNYQLHNRWKYAFNMTLNSQFANSFNSTNPDKVLTAQFFAPATLNLGVGITYKINDQKNFTFTPVSGNMTIVRNKFLSSQGSHGVIPNRLGKGSFGASATLNWQQPLLKHPKTGGTLIDGKIYAYSYTNYEQIPNLDLQAWLNLYALKFLSINVYAQLTFNDQIRPPRDSFWQFRQTLTINLTYEFKNKQF